MSTVYDILNQQNYYNNQSNNQLLGRLRQFAGALNGNPQQIVQELVRSGRLSQEQFYQLGQQASQIQQMFNLN